MIRRIKFIIKTIKVRKLADILEAEGKINEDEKTALTGVATLYCTGVRTEEEFVEEMTKIHEYLYSPMIAEEENLKKYRRAATWFTQSTGFRQRVLDFYFSQFKPLLEKKSIFEIYRLHKNIKYKMR